MDCSPNFGDSTLLACYTGIGEYDGARDALNGVFVFSYRGRAYCVSFTQSVYCADDLTVGDARARATVDPKTVTVGRVACSGHPVDSVGTLLVDGDITLCQ